MKNWKDKIKEFEIIIPDGELKDCLVYHESIKSLIESLLRKQKKEIIKEIELAQEQIQGGGNGKRILEMLRSKIKDNS